MERDWRQQLWIDFDRDRPLPIYHERDTIQRENAESYELFHRVEELRIDNKMATEDYLQGLLEHI